jgi:hypothetical protein
MITKLIKIFKNELEIMNLKMQFKMLSKRIKERTAFVEHWSKGGEIQDIDKRIDEYFKEESEKMKSINNIDIEIINLFKQRRLDILRRIAILRGKKLI